jgi:hypothetical protein
MSSSILNQANCVNGNNTGIASCSLDPAVIQRFIAIPKGYVVGAPLDTTALNAFLIARLHADDPAQRFYLSPLLTNFDDKTDSIKEEDRDGYKATTFLPPYNWQWLMNGSFCAFKNWRTFNFKQDKYDFLYIDNKGNLIGTAGTDNAGVPGLGGIALFEFLVPDYKPATIAKANQYMVSMKVLNNVELNDNMVMIPGALVPATLQNYGLLDVVLSAGTTSHSTTHIYVSGKMGCGQQSLGVIEGSTLAAAGAWVIYDNTALAAITPSAVAYDSSNDQYNFTVPTMTAGHSITVSLAAPSTLTATPYFFNGITETKNTYSFTV